MSDKPHATASLKVDLRSGEWLLAVPANFSFVGREADAVINMLPTITVQRESAA